MTDEEIIRQELLTDPLGVGYAPFLPNVGNKVVELINAKNRQIVKSRMVNARTVINEIDDAGTILAALDQASTVNATVRYAMQFLKMSDGLDCGSPRCRVLLDGLAAAGVLTTVQSEALKGMALAAGSRAEMLGFDFVRHVDIMRAMLHDDGSAK